MLGGDLRCTTCLGRRLQPRNSVAYELDFFKNSVEAVEGGLVRPLTSSVPSFVQFEHEE